MEKIINNKKKVIIAMSGGVDSSVAAVLLKKQNYDVVGVFMKFWSQHYSIAECGASQNRCCSTESEKRARAVAVKLKIPFYVYDFSKEFKKRVVDYFIKEYRAGRTPNPCVVCNKEIKFGLLLGKALAMGADYVATGHYARSLKSKIQNPNTKSISKSLPCRQAGKCQIYKLLKGKDKNKDQSYFLWGLGQKQLSRVIFPVGGYTKPQVRALARRFKLPTAETPESQEVCFVGKSTNDFLSEYVGIKSGKVIDGNGEIIGEHKGLCFYTIGQRKGIGLPGGPYYVVGKNIEKNILIVSHDKKDLLQKEMFIENVNWISGKLPKLPLKAEVKIRYGHKAAKAIIRKSAGKKLKIIFLKPQLAITSGQSAVFYSGQELLGGGIIV